MCQKALKQGLIIKYDVKAINRYQKIVIKETKHTIWSKEKLKEVLLAETPEKKNEIEKLYSFCTKKNNLAFWIMKNQDCIEGDCCHDSCQIMYSSGSSSGNYPHHHLPSPAL